MSARSTCTRSCSKKSRGSRKALRTTEKGDAPVTQRLVDDDARFGNSLTERRVWSAAIVRTAAGLASALLLPVLLTAQAPQGGAASGQAGQGGPPAGRGAGPGPAP